MISGDCRRYAHTHRIVNHHNETTCIWLLTLIGVQSYEVSCSSSLSRNLVRCPYAVLSPSVTRVYSNRARSPPFGFQLLYSSLPSIGGDSEPLGIWENIFGTVVPTSIWTHPLRTSASEVTCVLCRIYPSLFLQVVLTGGALGNAADFGTADPAGLPSFMERLTPDVPGGVHEEQAGNARSPEKALAGDPSASETKPFYKRRRFIISQVIACFVGIGLLFVLLFPVIKAIAQHIVNVSKLNIDRVMILEPTNTSYVLSPRSS